MSYLDSHVMFVMFVAGLCDECCVITPTLLPRMGLVQCCFAKAQRVNIVIGVSFYFVHNDTGFR